MLELILAIFVLLIALAFMAMPFVLIGMLVTYLVAPGVLWFDKREKKNKRYSREEYDYRPQGQTYTRPEPKTEETVKPEPAKTEPAKPKKPRQQVIMEELQKHSEGILDQELKDTCTEIIAKLEKIRKLEADSSEISAQMENMYKSYLPTFINVLSRYERLQYASDQTTVEEYRQKVLHTAKIIDDALDNICDAAAQANIDAMGKDMSELELALKADGMAGNLELPKQQ